MSNVPPTAMPLFKGVKEKATGWVINLVQISSSVKSSQYNSTWERISPQERTIGPFLGVSHVLKGLDLVSPLTASTKCQQTVRAQ